MAGILTPEDIKRKNEELDANLNNAVNHDWWRNSILYGSVVGPITDAVIGKDKGGVFAPPSQADIKAIKDAGLPTADINVSAGNAQQAQPIVDPFGYVNRTQIGTSSTTRKMVDPKDLAALDSANKALEDAARKIGSAESANALAEKAARQGYQTEADKQWQGYQTQVGDLNAKIETTEKEIREAKIDPSRYWSNASSGQKALASIGALFGGFAEGFSGGKVQGQTLAIMDKLIERDIDAQKQDLNKKSNLLTFYMNRLGRVDLAYSMTKSKLMESLANQISINSADMRSETAKANAEKVAAELRQRAAALRIDLAPTRTSSGTTQMSGIARVDPKTGKFLGWANPQAGQGQKDPLAELPKKDQEALTAMGKVLAAGKNYRDMLSQVDESGSGNTALGVTGRFWDRFRNFATGHGSPGIMLNEKREDMGGDMAVAAGLSPVGIEEAKRKGNTLPYANDPDSIRAYKMKTSYYGPALAYAKTMVERFPNNPMVRGIADQLARAVAAEERMYLEARKRGQ